MFKIIIWIVCIFCIIISFFLWKTSVYNSGELNATIDIYTTEKGFDVRNVPEYISVKVDGKMVVGNKLEIYE